MSATGYATFDTTLAKTNGILKQVEQAYNWPRERRNRSYNALRAVLHAVRDRLTVEEAAQLSAQLPMLVRGIYFEGWDPTRVPGAAPALRDGTWATMGSMPGARMIS